MKTDLRAHLQAVAKGKTPPAVSTAGAPVLEPEFVEQEQEAFRAWEMFTASTDRSHFDAVRGETLAAPSELLSPLP